MRMYCTYVYLLVPVSRVSMHPTNVIPVTRSKTCSSKSRGLAVDGRFDRTDRSTTNWFNFLSFQLQRSVYSPRSSLSTLQAFPHAESRQKAKWRSEAVPRSHPLQSLSDCPTRSGRRPFYYPLKNHKSLGPGVPRNASQDPRRTSQNLVRKGNLTWSALDILDFTLHTPESLFSLWKSTQKSVIGCGIKNPTSHYLRFLSPS